MNIAIFQKVNIAPNIWWIRCHSGTLFNKSVSPIAWYTLNARTQLSFHMCKIKDLNICDDSFKILPSQNTQPKVGSQSPCMTHLLYYCELLPSIQWGPNVAQIIPIFYSREDCILHKVNLSQWVGMWLLLCSVYSLTPNKTVVKMWTL